jgi:HSP20 family molecular chaperone IbpA
MSNLSLWSARSPFAEFDELVRRAFGPSAQAWPVARSNVAPANARPSGFRPAAEVSRDGDDAVVRVEVPGLDAEKDVTVEVTGGRLVVRGERRDERSSEDGGARFREVRYGRFERSWTLPEHVGPEAVSAGYDAGVLTLRVAGVHAEAPGHGTHRIPVTGSAPVAPAVDAAEETAGEAHGEPESAPADETAGEPAAE